MIGNTSPGSFTFQVVKVNGKRMNGALFRQLYTQIPHNENYELLYELGGKVRYQGKEFVLFTTPNGIRKFDISAFKTKAHVHSLAASLYCCVCEIPSMELDSLNSEIHAYYLSKKHEFKEDSYVRETLIRLLSGKNKDYFRRKEDGEILLGCLEGSFKIRVEDEYKSGLARVENYNKLTDLFDSVFQIFI